MPGRELRVGVDGFIWLEREEEQDEIGEPILRALFGRVRESGADVHLSTEVTEARLDAGEAARLAVLRDQLAGHRLQLGLRHRRQKGRSEHRPGIRLAAQQRHHLLGAGVQLRARFLRRRRPRRGEEHQQR